MDQSQRRRTLIRMLLDENENYRDITIPDGEAEQRRLLRSLMNVRCPAPVPDEFIALQNEYLGAERDRKGIVTLNGMDELQPGLYLWQGDITRLAVDAIVNAANSGMTGCYRACHTCIDNCIHTFAGVQLRNFCADIMDRQGYDEPTGRAKLTPAFNLPCRYVLHTVGPIVQGRLTERHEELLRSCYRSCLQTAAENGIGSVAFCCISTGVFMFPNRRAAEIAVETVREYRGGIKVVFNVFKDEDLAIYRSLLK